MPFLLDHPIYEIIPLSTSDAAIAALPPTSIVSVTCSPVKGLAATFELSAQVAAAGHTPVPHISARLVADEDQVKRIADWCRHLNIATMFVVGGDAEVPHGPFDSGLAFLRSFLDHDHGLTTIGVPSYPDGHALIERSVIDQALHDKVRLIESAGLAAFSSTQMCFDPDLVLRWLEGERAAGLTGGVHLGVPGAIDRTKLLAMGARLGIGASLRYLKKNRSTIRQLVSPSSFEPLELIEPLQAKADRLGISGIHLFTFNQVDATRRWLDEARSVYARGHSDFMSSEERVG